MSASLLEILPADVQSGLFLGRLDLGEGPTPVLVRQGVVEDLSQLGATVSEILERLAPDEAPPTGRRLFPIGDRRVAAAWDGAGACELLAPIDLQCVKAAGVTFALSTLERVIEERAGGDLQRAGEIRETLAQRIGQELSAVRPGSAAADELKTLLIRDGLWSQYLEVAIGPDAEIFTKAPVLSAVGWGAAVGVRADSRWNNPEPEVVLICDSQGRPRGAALGNDVNLRDFEGRSALLLGKAKDNNASCAIGPFIRLFDGRYTLDQVRDERVSLRVVGSDGFVLEGHNRMDQISRDPLELVGQACGRDHQYPDGFALFLGTLFAPTADRDGPGQGFTHKPGDRVIVRSPHLGRLENVVMRCDEAPPWRFGIAALMRNLVGRGLLKETPAT